MALMRSITGRLDLDEALAAIALHGPSCCALGQCRGNGVIGRISKGDANHLPAHDPNRAVISWRDIGVLQVIADDAHGRCRHVANRGATPDLSVSRSDRDIDRQVQLDETRLQQRHGQVIVQFNPGVGVAWRPPELLEDDLAGLPKRRS